MKRSLFIGAGVAAVFLAGAAVAAELALGDVVTVFTSSSAKLLCSNVFVAGRDPELAFEQDFRRLTSPGKHLALVKVKIDPADKAVSASLWGYKKRTAIFREGIGCTAAEGASVAQLRAQGAGMATALPAPDPAKLWPEGDATLEADLPDGVDDALLKAALDEAFTEKDPAKPVRTRAVVIIHRGRIIAERYSDGFNRDTAHLSNSVAKSVTSTLVGILVGQGRLTLDQPAPIAEWRASGDPRGAITLGHLLQMSSGLEFEESYEKFRSDITMQLVGGDLAGFAVSKPLVAPPGERWHYSTGTSNILGRIVREAAGPDFPTAFAFPRKALFEPLGMRTAVLEPDARGNFMGGSAFYASSRDYGRLGLLYLRDGVWDGRRILPKGWVDYVRTPVVDAEGSHGYGAQFWLNYGEPNPKRSDARMPEDAFLMNGLYGQNVVMIPSLDLVVVRHGQSEFRNWSSSALVAAVIKALPDANGKAFGR